MQSRTREKPANVASGMTPFLALAMQVSVVPALDFRPDLFFTGRTQGEGTVRVATSSRPRILSVQGTGGVGPDGSLVLDQAVTLDGKTTNRRFRLRRISSAVWAGTLTDGAGPVRATVTGNRLSLAYPMKRAGMRMTQTLTLQPGGRVVINRARVTLLGIGVAQIEERITKID